MIDPRKISHLRLVLSVLLAAGIFALDLSLPLGVAGGVPYVVLVLISFWSPRPTMPLLAATTGSVLTVLGYFLSAPAGIQWMVLTNRFLALFAIWMTALLGLQHRRRLELERRVQQRERTFKDREKLFLAVLDWSPAPVFLKDVHGRYLLINRWFDSALRIKSENIVGKLDHEIFPKEMADRFRQSDLEVLQAGGPLEFEGVIPTDTGVRTFLTLKYPLFDNQGNPYAICGLSTDITERKRAEEALRTARERLQHLVSSSPAVIYSSRASGNYGATFVSENVSSQLGYQPQEFIEDSSFWADRIHTQDAERVFRELPRLSDHGHHKHEYRFRHQDGSYRWMRDEMRLVRDSSGDPVEIVGCWIDITERKRAEVALRESEARFRAVFDRAAIGISMADMEGRLLENNPAFLKMVGYGAEELRGKPFVEFTHPEDAQIDLKLYEELVAGKRDHYQMEKRYIRKDGRLIDARLTVSLVRDAQGEPLFSVALKEDITERKRAEEVLRQSEARLSEAQRIARLGSWDWNLLTNEAVWSEEGGRIFGLGPQELAAQHDHFVKSVHPDDWLSVEKAVNEALYEGKPYGIDYRIVRRDGSVLNVHSQGKVMWDEAGRPIRMRGTVQDITERKQAEEALRKSETLLAEAGRIAHLGSWEWNPVTGELNVSDETCRIFGHTWEELSSYEAFLPMVHPDDRALIEAAITEALQGGKPYHIEYRIVLPDGSVRITNAQAEVFFDFTGKAIRMVGTVFDITERKQAEEQINASLREKEVLLQEIHHRVKNNMQILSSLLSLQCAQVKDEQARAIFKQSQNRVRSIALVHEKLYQSKDLSMIDFGEYIQSLGQSLLRSYGVDSNAITLKTNVEEGSVGLEAAVPCGLIVSELVSNSLKHAFPAKKRGRISVDLRRDGRDKRIIIVKDNGVGVPPEFDFRKSKSLGLQLVCSLADQIGGDIELRRKKGTEFRISFAPGKPGA